MRKNTERQSKIFAYLCKQPEHTAKRADIVNEFSHWYYTNAAQYIDGLLYRMHKNGKVRKPKPGYYQAVSIQAGRPGEPVHKSQTTLFQDATGT
jgi:glucan-binding YG repeat protein